MESHSKFFHLQTPFIKKDSKIVINDESRKSGRFPGEGTFSEVVEYNKHLTALKDLEILKNQYYDEYVTNLEQKVRQQRKYLSKSEDLDKVNIPKQKTLQPKVGKLQHHRLRHDKEYMRKVSKSKFYHLIAARDLMQRKGLLKNRTDEDDFWSRVTRDNLIWSQPIQSGIPQDAITRVMVNRFSSMSTHKKGIIKEHQHVKFDDSSTNHFDNLDINETNSDKVRDKQLKKLRVKMKFPKLHSLRNITPLPPIQQQSHDIADTSKKLKRLEKLRSTKHAYDIAMVHHAVTRRMMREHSLLKEKETEFILHNIVALPSTDDYFELQSNRDKSSGNMEKQLTFITEPVYGNDQVLIPELEYKYPSARKRVQNNFPSNKKSGYEKDKSKNSGKYEKISLPNHSKVEQNTTPLNFSMMLNQDHLHVKDAKTLNTVWVNYADSI